MRRQWWNLLNPIEWLKAAYEAIGLKHPTGSLIAVMVLSAIVGGALWLIAGSLVAKDKATAIPKPEINQVTGPCGVNQAGDHNKVGDQNCKTPQALQIEVCFYLRAVVRLIHLWPKPQVY